MSDELKPRPMPKMARTAARSWVARHLATVQNGLCPLCGKHIDLKIKGEGVVDHNHDTGEVRGVLHRSCNASEGKIANAAARWGCKVNTYAAIVPYLESLVRYLKQPGAGIIYFAHKSAEELADTRRTAANNKARARRAEIKAKQAVAIAARRVNPT